MIQTLSTVAVALICPLMMIFMMKGMHGHSNSHTLHGAPKKKFGSREEELQDLQHQLTNLQAQYDQLATEIQGENFESTPSRVRSPHLQKSPQR